MDKRGSFDDWLPLVTVTIILSIVLMIFFVNANAKAAGDKDTAQKIFSDVDRNLALINLLNKQYQGMTIADKIIEVSHDVGCKTQGCKNLENEITDFFKAEIEPFHVLVTDSDGKVIIKTYAGLEAYSSWSNFQVKELSWIQIPDVLKGNSKIKISLMHVLGGTSRTARQI